MPVAQEGLARFGDAENCLKHLERSRRALLHFVESLSDEHLFHRPAAGVWSPAEVLEHVSLVEESAGKIIRRLRKVALGEAEPFPPSPPGQTRPDISRAKALLGWEPRVPVREGLARTIAYFRDLQCADWHPEA
ncbi:DinB family protein, partial [Meiothermus hypogaeus]|uniref:DinB family protein n=1 Tax=Meiothermus hypogaeus TaxID=884155 RepID=UPI000E64CAC8